MFPDLVSFDDVLPRWRTDRFSVKIPSLLDPPRYRRRFGCDVGGAGRHGCEDGDSWDRTTDRCDWVAYASLGS